jgi:cation diffusion facilitator family transporter
MSGDSRPGDGPLEPERSAPSEHEQPEPGTAHGASHGSGMRAVFAALGANLGIAATKFAAFLITGSASMLAESVHSVADSANQALLLLGRNRAQREETEEHQFGFGSERYFYGFVVAVVLFTVGAAFSVYEGVERILHPEKLTSPVVALVVLVIAAGLEGFSFRTAIMESHQAGGPGAWQRIVRFIRRAKAPEVPAVLLEDSAALIGLVFALLGVVLTWVTHDDRWDGAGSLGIGALLGCVAVILAIETKSLLIGESATTDVERAIVTALEDGPEVERVIHLRTLHLGPETLLVAAKISVSREQSAAAVVAGIDTAERRVRAAVPIAELIYLEPDVYQDSRADLTDPAIRAARRSSLRPLSARPARPPSPPSPRPGPPASPPSASPEATAQEPRNDPPATPQP